MGQANISLLAGILAVIVASTVVTLIVLCKTKCRPRHTGSSKNLGKKFFIKDAIIVN